MNFHSRTVSPALLSESPVALCLVAFSQASASEPKTITRARGWMVPVKP